MEKYFAFWHHNNDIKLSEMGYNHYSPLFTVTDTMRDSFGYFVLICHLAITPIRGVPSKTPPFLSAERKIFYLFFSIENNGDSPNTPPSFPRSGKFFTFFFYRK